MEEIWKSLPRNVILDLLPSYIAGESSKESQFIIEQYAKTDPEIARLIRNSNLETDLFLSELQVNDDLGIKTLKRIRKRIRRQMFYVALSTICILLVPLLAMYFTDEVNWNWFDFLVAGILLFGAGLAYILISKISKRLVYRIAVGIAILAGLFLIWVNLAVGIIGSGSNEANLLYLGVLLVGIFGAVYWRLHPKGMSNTMFITSIAQFMVPFIAMIFWKSSMEEPPGVIQIILINTIFALAFAVSGVLFRKADEK